MSISFLHSVYLNKRLKTFKRMSSKFIDKVETFIYLKSGVVSPPLQFCSGSNLAFYWYWRHYGEGSKYRHAIDSEKSRSTFPVFIINYEYLTQFTFVNDSKRVWQNAEMEKINSVAPLSRMLLFRHIFAIHLLLASSSYFGSFYRRNSLR